MRISDWSSDVCSSDLNPELRALDFEAQAAEARILPAGALPDPTASVGFRGLDPDKPWRSAGADREVDYALRQRFPLWGKRGLARTAATQDAVAVGLDRITTARDLLSDAEAAYARHRHAAQAVAVPDTGRAAGGDRGGAYV